MHRLTLLCARHPWTTLLLTLALTAAAGWSALRTGTAAGTDANLGANHPAVRDFDAFLERFGGGYPVVVAYECSNPAVCTGVFDPAALEMADTVSQELLKASFVSRVSSPATTNLLIAGSDLGLDARRLFEEGAAVNDQELFRIALADPMWRGTIISEDGRAGAIVVELTSTEGAALSVTIHAIRDSIAPFAEAGFNFHVVGEAAVSVAAQETGRDSAARAGAFTGGMLFLALLVLLRSLRAVIASLITIGISSVWMIGLLPLLGWQQSHLTSGAATLILVLGCADCVHFVAHYLEVRPRFKGDLQALEATSRWVLAPCFLTTATTAAAFASFATSEVLALRQFGVMAGIGVSIAFALTFSLFPALLTLLPPRPRRLQYSTAWQEVLGRLARLGFRRRRTVLALSAGLATLGVLGIHKLRVEMDVAELWGPDHPVTRAIEFVSEHLQRVDRLEIGLAFGPGAEIEDPETLRVVAALEDELLHVPGIHRSQSLVTVLRHTHHLVSGADLRSLPNSASAVGELIVLVSSGAPGVLEPWLTVDSRHTRLSLEVEDLSMLETTRLLSDVNRIMAGRIPSDWTYQVTGPLVLMARFGEEFGRSQSNIVSISSVLVVAIIGIYLRSLPWALLAAIPNAIALILMFGTMGHWGILLNFGSAIVAPIAIGIAADDTIHFLTAYSRERRLGKQPVAAVTDAIAGVGEAVIATAIALSLGFLSMMTSPMATVADMGLLCAIAILGATAADLLVLPALIASVSAWKGFISSQNRHE
jgi:predicted RND superfamily exporter protein